MPTAQSVPSAFVTTSWDDGSPFDFKVAELLIRHSLPGTFYIPRTCEHTSMSASDIRRISADFEIGGHTMDHVTLTDTEDARARLQIGDCRTWLQDVTGKSCTMFCPPRGRYHRQHLPMIQSAGFIGLRSVELLSLDSPRCCGGLAVLPTTIQAHPHGRLAYFKNVARRLAVRNAWHYITAGAPAGWTRLAASLADTALRRGGVFHLWGHSWEIEEAGQWRQLEDVLKMLGSFGQEFHRLGNGDIARLQTENCRSQIPLT